MIQNASHREVFLHTHPLHPIASLCFSLFSKYLLFSACRCVLCAGVTKKALTQLSKKWGQMVTTTQQCGVDTQGIWTGSSQARLGELERVSWMRQTCILGILETKYRNKLAVELSEGAILQAEAAKELRQGSEGVRRRAFREMQLQCEARGGKGRGGIFLDALRRYIIVRPSHHCVKPSSGFPQHSKSRNLKGPALLAPCHLSPSTPATVCSLSFIPLECKYLALRLVETVLYW